MCFRFFHIVERMSRNQRRRVCFVQFAMWQNRERNLPTPTASYLTWTTNFTHTHTHTHTYEKFNSILQLVEYWCWQTNRDKQITACTVVQAVVKANSQSNGKRQISTPPPSLGSKTPERISMKLGTYNYVMGVTTPASPCGAATMWVVWANTWLVTCWFLIVYLKNLAPCFGSRRARTSEPISATCTSYDMVPEVALILHPTSGGQIPQKHFLGVNRHLQA